eukprot:592028-Pleurochrysis_carterae.AAC.1
MPPSHSSLDAYVSVLLSSPNPLCLLLFAPPGPPISPVAPKDIASHNPAHPEHGARERMGATQNKRKTEWARERMGARQNGRKINGREREWVERE